jgi:probable F420-dependent oxidoreductase
MRIGAVFPTCEIGNDPGAIRDFAQTAEGLGYSHLIVYDHVLGAVHDGREPKLGGPYTERDPFHEPFVLYGYLAGLTQKLELATGVIILPQRQTALVAKQAAEVALLSRGRLRLGVGTGWNWVEYEALNESFGSRGKRLDEQVELLRQLWSGTPIDFEGRYHRVDRAGILPAPPGPIPCGSAVHRAGDPPRRAHRRRLPVRRGLAPHAGALRSAREGARRSGAPASRLRDRDGRLLRRRARALAQRRRGLEEARRHPLLDARHEHRRGADGRDAARLHDATPAHRRARAVHAGGEGPIAVRRGWQV